LYIAIIVVFLTAFSIRVSLLSTEFQFYWYYESTCFGQPFCPSSGVLSRTSALVHFCRRSYATRSRMEHPAPGSIRPSYLQKCTNADVRLRTPDDGQKGWPKHVES